MKKPNTTNQTQQPESLHRTFKGLDWDEPLTQKRIRHIEDTYGPLAKTLIELAGLVRKSYCEPLKAVSDGKGNVTIDATHSIEVGKNRSMSFPLNMYGFVIPVLASAKLLRTEIESAAGGELQGRKFYETMVTALQGLDVSYCWFSTSEIKFKGKEEVETIAKTLESWHSENLLIYASTQGKGGEGEKKKRGRGKLNEQVGELLDRIKWPTDMTATKITKILNTENSGTYRDTSADAVRDTTNWKKLQNKKR